MSQIGSEKYLIPPPASSEHINFSELQIPCFPISACHWKGSVTPPYDQRRNGFHALLLLKHYHRAPCCVHGTSSMGKTHGSERGFIAPEVARALNLFKSNRKPQINNVPCTSLFTCFRTHFSSLEKKRLARSTIS